MTVKQKQALLLFLGYYVGNIDGKWGQLSETATKAFQADYGLEADGICGPKTEKALKHAVTYGMPVRASQEAPTITPIPFDWKNIQYFERREFRCKCGKCGGYPVEPDPKLIEILVKIREHFKAPVRINSGVRCVSHNTACGGAKFSQHLAGTAADIRVDGVSPAEVAKYAETLLPDTGGIGIYDMFVHVDVRKTKSRWNG